MEVTAGNLQDDVSLLFGVLGGGSISGESGARIKKQIDQITRELNKNQEVESRGIKFSARIDKSKLRQDLVSGVQGAFDQKHGGEIPKIKISKIDASGAISNLRRDINRMLNTLSAEHEVKISLPTDIGEITGNAATQRAASIAKNTVLFKAQLATLTNMTRTLTSAFKSASYGSKRIKDEDVLGNLTKEYTAWMEQLELIREDKRAMSSEELAANQKECQAITKKISLLQEEAAVQKSGVSKEVSNLSPLSTKMASGARSLSGGQRGPVVFEENVADVVRQYEAWSQLLSEIQEKKVFFNREELDDFKSEGERILARIAALQKEKEIIKSLTAEEIKMANARNSALTATTSTLTSTYKSALRGDKAIKNPTLLEGITSEYNSLIESMQQHRALSSVISDEDFQGYHRASQQLIQRIELLQKEDKLRKKLQRDNEVSLQKRVTALSGLSKKIESGYRPFEGDGADILESKDELSRIVNSYKEWKAVLEQVRQNKRKLSEEEVFNMEQEGTSLVKRLKALHEEKDLLTAIAIEEKKRAVARNGVLNTTESTLNSAYKSATRGEKAIQNPAELRSIESEYNALIETMREHRALQKSISEEDIRYYQASAQELVNRIALLQKEQEVLKNIQVGQYSKLAGTKSSLSSSFNSAYKGKSKIEDESAFVAIRAQYMEWLDRVNRYKAEGKELSDAEVISLQDQGRELIKQIELVQKKESRVRELANEQEKAAQKSKERANDTVRMQKDALVLQKKMTTALAGFGAAANTPEYRSIERGKSAVDAMLSGIEKLDRAKLDNLTEEFSRAEGYIRAAGKATKTTAQAFAGNAKKFIGWLGVSQSIMYVVSLLKDMVRAVADVDAAMTELKRVTDETDVVYAEFLDDAVVRSKELGASIVDTVRATADFARLGNSIFDATKLADAALVYKNVGDNIESIDDASSGIISTMQAFGVAARDAMTIVDKFNSVGNNFAITSKGVGDALMRSASSLEAAGNSLDESIALLTAANGIVQDPEKVGTALKTVSMFLRAAKVDAEEAGVSTEGMAESVSKLRDKILALTGNKVDIQLDENTFKSTYQILQEISKVWDSITDVNRAGLLELIGGKRNSNVVSALLTNFQTAERVVDVAANSAGSALQENDRYLDSIQGKVDHLEAQLQNVSLDIINSDALKNLADFASFLVSIVEELSDAKLLLPAVIAGFSAFKIHKAQVAILGDEEQEKVVASLIEKLTAEKTVTESLQRSYISLNKARREAVTDSIRKADGISDSDKGDILAGLTGADELAAGSEKLRKFGVALAGVSTILPIVINLIDYLHKSTEELHLEYEETANELDGYNKKLSENRARLEELYKLRRSGAISLENSGELKTLEAENEQIERKIRLLKDLADIEAKKSNDSLVKDYDKSSHGRDIYDTRTIVGTSSAEAAKELEAQLNEIKRDYPNGSTLMPDSVLTQVKELEARITSLRGTVQEWGEMDVQNKSLESYISLLIGRIKELESLPDMTGQELVQYDTLKEKLAKAGEELQNSYIDMYAGEDVPQSWLDLAEAVDIALHPVEHFVSLLKKMPGDLHDKLFAGAKEGTLTAEMASEIVSQYGDLAKVMEDCGFTIEDVVRHYYDLVTAGVKVEEGVTEDYTSVEKLQGALSELSGLYDLVARAQKEMYKSGNVTSETILELAKNVDNYTDYLTTENGVLRLNIQKLKELGRSKYEPNISGLKKEIQLLEKKNEVLSQPIASGGLASESAKGAISSEIADNNKEIERLISLLHVYESAQNPWEETLSTFDAAYESLKSLASVQEVISEGYTISAANARKFAEVYPELFEMASATADGEIALNKNVADAFLERKRVELNGEVDTEIQKLESRKQLLLAQLDLVGVQLEAVRSGDEAEVKSANEAAATKMLLQQAVMSAAQQSGIDETTANQMALAAMAEDWDTFSTLAEQAMYDLDDESALSFNRIMSNFSRMAANMTGNTKEMVKSFSNLGIAIKNAYDKRATNAYSASITKDYVYGRGKDAVDGVIKSMFEADKSDLDLEHLPPSKEKEFMESLDSIMAHYNKIGANEDALIAQRDSLRKQISSISSQIDLLESMKNISLDKFITPKKPGKTGGKHKAEEVKKEVEEYIASIDKYREALERLARTQITVAEIEQKIDGEKDLKAKIVLQRELIKAYQREDEALKHLSSQRKETIEAGARSLRKLGFEVEYDADKNQLWIANLEHVNELVATNKGEYDSLTEATNAFRKETEELASSIVNLNKENIDCAQSHKDLQDSINDAKDSIDQLLKDIVSQASETVDSIQDVYDALHGAADEYTSTGYVSVDTLQSIIGLGVEYMAYLTDENGKLVINEERIRGVIAARTEQLAVESALSYVEALRIAKEEKDYKTLGELTTRTTDATRSTWDLVYANLALLNLSDDQMKAALANIDAIRSLANNAIHGIGNVSGSVSDELNEMKSGLDSILEYVMDMIKHDIDEQIESLNEMKRVYGDIIDKKKESLRAEKEEKDYQKDKASKLKEIAKLQAKADILALDSSREGQAKRQAVLEEMQKLQEELTESQADHALDAQEDALDKMKEGYDEEKDGEISKLEESISSYQKLYDKAIQYIKDNWDDLYAQLIGYNQEYGDSLNSDITKAWENCLAAAKRYGDYVTAIGKIDKDIGAAGTPGSNGVVGPSLPSGSDSVTNESMVKAIVNGIRRIGTHWDPENTDSFNDSLHKQVADEVNRLPQYGVKAKFNSNGEWRIVEDKLNPGNVGKLLIDCYHTGGIVGGGDIKENERIALLKEKEWVLNESMVDNLVKQMDRIATISAYINSPENSFFARVPKDYFEYDKIDLQGAAGDNHVEIVFGDTIINGSSSESVKQHIEVNRKMVDQIARLLRLKM